MTAHFGFVFVSDLNEIQISSKENKFLAASHLLLCLFFADKVEKTENKHDNNGLIMNFKTETRIRRKSRKFDYTKSGSRQSS